MRKGSGWLWEDLQISSLIEFLRCHRHDCHRDERAAVMFSLDVAWIWGCGVFQAEQFVVIAGQAELLGVPK